MNRKEYLLSMKKRKNLMGKVNKMVDMNKWKAMSLQERLDWLDREIAWVEKKKGLEGIKRTEHDQS